MELVQVLKETRFIDKRAPVLKAKEGLRDNDRLPNKVMAREKKERVAGPYEAVLREEGRALINDHDRRPTEGRTRTR